MHNAGGLVGLGARLVCPARFAQNSMITTINASQEGPLRQLFLRLQPLPVASYNLGTELDRPHDHDRTCANRSMGERDHKGLCLQDSPLGVRYADKVSVFPAGVNVAATFNRDLIQKRGAALGAEFKGKGVHVALGPAVNIARVPAAGRNWEGFGADPYLSGEAAYETVIGIQSQGVQACAKHYINNEQEHFRETSSSNVDDSNMKSTFLPS
ncbi:hypothetical protein BN14_01785 [Rhizoctonia solani AG-1 IB]|uniref:beta-glucosidase n=1 Tax=Thanatephorus cucumeris (strain AG1-IB / isolate 7/3/14) TaxID=1108050 RepID=M5BVL5_THACB|nr:hypothetical protein BN14_01785 [Rhizoctonia solani AG-1 IB]